MINYFELFKIPVHYYVDLTALRKQFYVLSRQTHLDQNQDADAQAESSKLNEAYKILSDPILRLKHIIELFRGQAIEENVPFEDQGFIMQMMDLHEKIQDAMLQDSSDDFETVRSEIEDYKEFQLHHMQKDLLSIDQLDKLEDPLVDKLIQYYFKLKYFNRLEKAISGDDLEL